MKYHNFINSEFKTYINFTFIFLNTFKTVRQGESELLSSLFQHALELVSVDE
jgi:FMN-dependent NADH-azoreductase